MFENNKNRINLNLITKEKIQRYFCCINLCIVYPLYFTDQHCKIVQPIGDINILCFMHGISISTCVEKQSNFKVK